MYEDDELILRPDWQRYYVWSNKQASQLVESLFLRLPIPLIYLAEEEDGTFTVVDGQQRLTALIEFIRNKRIDPTNTSDVKLTGVEVLTTELDGKTFAELDKKDQTFLKNRELAIVRLRSDSDPDVKLKVFRRLNTGSVKLNSQELRNVAFRGPYNDELKKWAKNPVFLKMLRSDAKPDLRMLDVEMVLRLCAWLNRGWTTLTNKNLSQFLDEEMEFGKVYKPAQLKKQGKQFQNAVDLSWQAFGERAFRRYFPGLSDEEREGEWEMRQPNKALYDVVVFGFTRKTKAQFWPHLEAIRESLIDLMATDPKFQDAITSGTTDQKRLNYRFTTWLARLDEDRYGRCSGALVQPPTQRETVCGGPCLCALSSKDPRHRRCSRTPRRALLARGEDHPGQRRVDAPVLQPQGRWRQSALRGEPAMFRADS